MAREWGRQRAGVLLCNRNRNRNRNRKFKRKLNRNKSERERGGCLGLVQWAMPATASALAAAAAAATAAGRNRVGSSVAAARRRAAGRGCCWTGCLFLAYSLALNVFVKKQPEPSSVESAAGARRLGGGGGGHTKGQRAAGAGRHKSDSCTQMSDLRRHGAREPGRAMANASRGF